MDHKLIEMAREAGFPLTNGEHVFSVTEKKGLLGSSELELDTKIQKLADLLFDDFVSQWWVKRYGTTVNKP